MIQLIANEVESRSQFVPGANQVTSDHAGTGEKAWWVRGFSWQPKSLPVIDGDTIYVHGWEGGGDAETPTETPTFAETLAKRDANHDGKLSVAEFSDDPRIQKQFYTIDLNDDGLVDERDWKLRPPTVRNTLLAILHGGGGDLTRTNVAWSMQKFLPNCPSPLVYQGVLYLVKDGGILTTLDPKTGKMLKQGRLLGALGTYYASPVAAAGKVYLTSQEGKVTVIKVVAIGRCSPSTISTTKGVRDAGDRRQQVICADARDAVLLLGSMIAAAIPVIVNPTCTTRRPTHRSRRLFPSVSSSPHRG